MKKNRILIGVVLAVLLLFGLLVVAQDEPDTLGEHIDESVEQVGEKLEDAADGIEDGLEDMGDELD